MSITRLLFLVVVFASQQLSAASAETIPDSMRGIWVPQEAGRCEDAKRIFMVGTSAVLVFESDPARESVAFGPSTSIAGALVLTRSDQDVILETSLEDGTRCDRLPGRYYAFFGEALALFNSFDAIALSCERDDSSTCLDTAFRFADVSGDGELAQAEIARVLRAVAFYVAYEITVASRKTSDQTQMDPWEMLQVPTADLAGATVLASMLGPFFSDNLVSSYDFDASGSVSLAELLQDRGPDEIVGAMGTVGSAAAQTGLQVLFGMLQQLAGALPGVMGSGLR